MPKGQIPWNKNLTKETDERLMIVSKKVSKTKKGITWEMRHEKGREIR